MCCLKALAFHLQSLLLTRVMVSVQQYERQERKRSQAFPAHCVVPHSDMASSP